jgi:hypothetical protein
VELDGAAYHGHVYGEHDADDNARRPARLWASLDNESSFWFTEPSLLNLFARAGYTSSSRSWCRPCRATCATARPMSR